MPPAQCDRVPPMQVVALPDTIRGIVFDIDGTLMHYAKTWDSCFLQAFRDLFEFKHLSDDWMTYKHSTDSGIADEIFAENAGREPEPNEIQQAKEYYIKLFYEQNKGYIALFCSKKAGNCSNFS